MGLPVTGRRKSTENWWNHRLTVILTETQSPNSGPRRLGQDPDMVVLHHTAMQSAEAAIARLCDPAFEVSAHYVIAENGAVTRLVPEDLRAWHAGAGQWGKVVDVNSHSIGIELANAGPLVDFPPFAAAQMDALEVLLAGIMARHNIRAERVIAHSDMAPGRKADPGAKFDWQRLANAGLSIWPEAKGDPDVDFLTSAKAFGYPDTPDTLAAFRLRFCPSATGPESAMDRAIIDALAKRWPVDASLGTA